MRDVFALACNEFQKEKMNGKVLMEATKSGRTIINKGVTITVIKYEPIMKSLLAVHPFSGCDTVCYYQGISKKKVNKLLEKQPSIHLLDCHLMLEKVIAEAALFLSLCYRTETWTTISEKR